MTSRKIEGVQVLLSTPMFENGDLDYDSAFRLLDHVMAGGVDGIILLGSTGEFFSLSETERREFSEQMIAYAGRRVPVGVCPGTAGTRTTVDLARHAEASGADYLLVPLPYYFTNTFAGMADFYRQVASSVSIPIMPYDGGGGLSLDPELWRSIVCDCPNVSLAKITVPFPTKIKWLLDEFGGRVTPFGGSDSTVLLSLANGAQGLTVAGANVVPAAFARTFQLYRSGNLDQARCHYYRDISPLNVIAVAAHTEFIQCYKQALYWMGVIATPHSREPMMPLDEPRKTELRAALERMGVPMPCLHATAS